MKETVERVDDLLIELVELRPPLVRLTFDDEIRPAVGRARAEVVQDSQPDRYDDPRSTHVR